MSLCLRLFKSIIYPTIPSHTVGDWDIPATPEGKATSLSSGAIHLLGTTVTGSA